MKQSLICQRLSTNATYCPKLRRKQIQDFIHCFRRGIRAYRIIVPKDSVNCILNLLCRGQILRPKDRILLVVQRKLSGNNGAIPRGKPDCRAKTERNQTIESRTEYSIPEIVLAFFCLFHWIDNLSFPGTTVCLYPPPVPKIGNCAILYFKDNNPLRRIINGKIRFPPLDIASGGDRFAPSSLIPGGRVENIVVIWQLFQHFIQPVLSTAAIEILLRIFIAHSGDHYRHVKPPPEQALPGAQCLLPYSGPSTPVLRALPQSLNPAHQKVRFCVLRKQDRDSAAAHPTSYPA